METRQIHIKGQVLPEVFTPFDGMSPDVLIVFGDVSYFEKGDLGATLKRSFPNAIIVGCSTAGEIVKGQAYEGTLVITGLNYPGAKWHLVTDSLNASKNSRAVGEMIGLKLAPHQLNSIFVLSPGLTVNGSELVIGLERNVGSEVVITGGLAGDGLNFKKTYTLFNETITSNTVVALGLFAPKLHITYGTQGGWQPFGPLRRVTRAENNILYELDGVSALSLYKEYLGEKAKDLPGSGLLYPLYVISSIHDVNGFVRSILDINEKEGSITLAGDVAQGHIVRLMHAKRQNLIEGARQAGVDTLTQINARNDALGILVSCIGRKVVMGDDVDEEIAAVAKSFKQDAVLTGFYSYGEICPYNQTSLHCGLHNQTMTVTRITS